MNKIKIMLHFVMPGSIGGPNIVFQRIMNSKKLMDNFIFSTLNQNFLPGGKFSFKLIIDLMKQIKKFKPDIVHISGMQSSGFHAMLASFFCGVKVRIVTTHGFQGDAINISKIKRFIFDKIIEPFTMIMASHVLCISKYTLQNRNVIFFAKNKSSLIYNYGPIFVKEKKNSLISRVLLGYNEKDIIFLTVSRIIIDKGFQILAKAIKKLNKIANIKFLIVGDGPYLQELEKILEPEITNGKVKIYGRSNYVNELMKISDVFLLPTLHENLGNVFIEAGYASLPSIGTNIGGVPEIIKEGFTGLLVKKGDVPDLVSAINKIAKDQKIRVEMGNNAFNFVSKNFDNEFISNQYYFLYNSFFKKNDSK